MLVSKRKRYLSGSDWVINTLDHMMKNATCAGNMSQVVLRLDSSVDENAVRTGLNRFVRQFPVLQGRVSRDLKLAPYWKIPVRADRDPAFSAHVAEDTGNDGLIPAGLEKSVNTPFSDSSDHLSFHLFQNGRRSLVAMTFDHSIFDARGAELFLDLFQKNMNAGENSVSGDIAFASSSSLTQWSRKFLAGRNVNRRIIAISKTAPEALPVPVDGNRGFRYRLLSFNEQETAAIYEQAYKEAGYLMESPYLLSAVIQSMNRLFTSRGASGKSYLIPVTMDLRQGKDPLQEIFFNYVSYLFYHVPSDHAEDRKGLIALLKQQMFDHVKSGFPRDLAEASLLTRIAPLHLLGRLLHIPMKGKMATFAFSHLGKSSYQQTEFMGQRIENVFHMPRVPVPPGIGFFSNDFNGRLNLVVSYLDGMLRDDEIGMLEREIRLRLGASRT